MVDLTGDIYREAGPQENIDVLVNGQTPTESTTGPDWLTFGFDSTLPVGEQPIRAAAPGHLSCEGTLNLTAGENTLSQLIALLSGDADGDDVVNIRDATIVSLAWNTSGTPGHNDDFNADGTINVLDLIEIGRNFDQVGPQPCQP
ncbi:MAG: dockerin type I domain-containing protein [Chloroflexota bacterium]